MKAPFQVHADLTAQYQALVGGQPGNKNRASLSTITIFNKIIPCSISPIVFDYELIPGGRSPRTFVEQCEFLVSDGPANPQAPGTVLLLTKGTPCSLIVSNQQNPPQGILVYQMKLYHGGLLPAGLEWRFMLVDAAYEA
jgi:hypothetical protein